MREGIVQQVRCKMGVYSEFTLYDGGVVNLGWERFSVAGGGLLRVYSEMIEEADELEGKRGECGGVRL